jgi:hypothetical protein
MKKLGRAVWAFTYVLGTVIATILLFPAILIVAILHTIGKTIGGQED